MKSIRLIFKNEKSAKEYNASIEQIDDGYIVNFAYGKLNQALRTGTKTANPVPLDKATTIFEKLIKEKVKKGYLVDDDANENVSIELVAHSEVIKVPQLSNPVTKTQMADLLRHKSYLAQTKYDGERRIVIVTQDTVTGLNRKGTAVPFNPRLKAGLLRIAQATNNTFTVDCEDMGKTLRVFDALEVNGTNIESDGFAERVKVLALLADDFAKVTDDEVTGCFEFVPTTQIESTADLDRVLADNDTEEGIVLRASNAPYESGRPASLGNSLKIKNWNDLSAVVMDIHDAKRSVSLGVYDEDNTLIPIGNVTVPANHEVPKQNDVVDVKYLWMINSLIQPSFMRNRTAEIDKSACVASQLVYKQAS